MQVEEPEGGIWKSDIVISQATLGDFANNTDNTGQRQNGEMSITEKTSMELRKLAVARRRSQR